MLRGDREAARSIMRHIEAVEQILPEGSRLDRFATFRSLPYQPDIHFDRPRSTDAIEFTLLETRQQFVLHPVAHFTISSRNTVPPSRFHFALFLRNCTCERSFLVAQKLTFQE